MRAAQLLTIRISLAVLVLLAAAASANAQFGPRRTTPRPRPGFFGPNFGAAPARAVAGMYSTPNLAFVFEQANAAFVSHGLQDNEARNSLMPIEIYQAQGFEFLGLDVLKLDWVMGLAAFDNLENPSPTGAIVARFTEPYDKQRVLAAIQNKIQDEFATDPGDSRRSNLTLPSGVVVSIVFHDDKTILAGVNQDIDRMLASKATQGPLEAKLRSLSGEQNYAVMHLEPLRGQIKAMLAKEAPAPPPFQPFLEIPKKLRYVETVSSQRDSLNLMLRLDHDDEASAKETARLIESTIEMGAQMVEGQMLGAMTQQFKGESEYLQAPMTAYVRRITRLLIDSVKREQFGTQVTLRAEVASQSSIATAGVLVALLAPAVQQAREAARRVQSTNNLKMIMLAMHVYHESQNKLPARAIRDKEGKPLLSWRVALLPYLEENDLYQQFHLDEPWDSEHNKTLIERMPSVYKSPGVDASETTLYLAVSGDDSLLEAEKETRFRDVTDGLSNTIGVVEADPDRAVVWTKPDDFEYDPERPLKGLGGLRHTGFAAAFADGAVRVIENTTDEKTLRGLFTKSGGEPVLAPE